MRYGNFEDTYGDNERREGGPVHVSDNPDGTCSDLTCPCQTWSRQDTPLVQLPLEHAGLQSPAEALRSAVEQRFDTEWSNAPLFLTAGDRSDAFYWWLKGRQAALDEAVEAQHGDLRELRRLVEGRVER